MKRTRALVLVPLVALTLVAGPAEPALAAKKSSGAMKVDLFARMPTFPCPGPGVCFGGARSTHRGRLQGKDGQKAWTFNNLNATVVSPERTLVYHDGCDPATPTSPSSTCSRRGRASWEPTRDSPLPRTS